MKLLEDYFALQKEIYDYFGYIEDWRVIPIDDATKHHWMIVGTEERGSVRYGTKEAVLDYSDNSNSLYINRIFAQQFLPKRVYRGKDYTMISCNPQTDVNKFLRIFSNSLELKDASL